MPRCSRRRSGSATPRPTRPSTWAGPTRRRSSRSSPPSPSAAGWTSSAISVEGIERVSLADIEHAAELGYRIRLLGVAQMTEEGLEARMQPCLVPAGSPPGQLTGVTNMVVVEGDFVGRIVLSGPGAGAGPTASAIVGDIIDIARGNVIPPFGQPAASLAVVAPAGDGAPAAYYLRFLVTDAPGVLAQVATELGAAGISINRMRQVEHAGEEAPILIVTHRAERAALDRGAARHREARGLPRGAGGDPHRGGVRRGCARRDEHDRRRPRPALDRGGPGGDPGDLRPPRPRRARLVRGGAAGRRGDGAAAGGGGGARVAAPGGGGGRPRRSATPMPGPTGRGSPIASRWRTRSTWRRRRPGGGWGGCCWRS